MNKINHLFEDFKGNLTDIKQMYYLCKDFINKHDNKEREEKIKNNIRSNEKIENEKIENTKDKLTSDDIKCYERKYKYINYQIEKHIQFNIKKIKIEIIYSGDTWANGTYQLIINNIEICDESKELDPDEIIKIIEEELDDDERCDLNCILNDNNIKIKGLIQFIHQNLHYL
jgi:hypothetical protein